MSFFSSFAFHTLSPIEGLLDNPDTTLEAILDEPDILQECKCQNRRLIDLFVAFFELPFLF